MIQTGQGHSEIRVTFLVHHYKSDIAVNSYTVHYIYTIQNNNQAH